MSFPRHFENRIQALLDHAEPRTIKAFHLYKTCQRAENYKEDFEKFQQVLLTFFTKPQYDRKKSDLDQYLLKPLANVDFDEFHLTFHNAAINGLSLQELSNWTYNLMRVGLKFQTAILSQDMIHRSLHRLTNPMRHEKGEHITFRDFYQAWGTTVKSHYGDLHSADLNHIINELKWLETQEKEAEETRALHRNSRVLIYLTQTEIYWVQDVLRAVEFETVLPKYPLSRGPSKAKLCDLERTAKLYKIVQTTKLPELLLHKEKIKNTLIAQCEDLLQCCDKGIAS